MPFPMKGGMGGMAGMMDAKGDGPGMEVAEMGEEQDSPIVAALKQAKQAIDDAIVAATLKKREGSPAPAGGTEIEIAPKVDEEA